MRPKQFDPEQALESAMELFWRRGYEATGITDLVEHLGIARASLYATFGSKEQLYCRALDRYCELRAGPVLEALEAPGSVLPRIVTMLERLADAPLTDADRRGCLVVNAAMERIPADAAVTERVAAHLHRDEEVLTRALQRAQDQGEISPGGNPRELSRFLVATIQGLRVVGKSTADSAVLHDVVAVAIRSLAPLAGSSGRSALGAGNGT